MKVTNTTIINANTIAIGSLLQVLVSAKAPKDTWKLLQYNSAVATEIQSIQQPTLRQD